MKPLATPNLPPPVLSQSSNMNGANSHAPDRAKPQNLVSVVIGVFGVIDGSGDNGGREGKSRVVMCFVEASAALGKHHQSHAVFGNGFANHDGMGKEP